MVTCKECKKEYDIKECKMLHTGEARCLRCQVAWLDSFEQFTSYWLKYKCHSQNGKKINGRIVQETREELKDA